MQLIVIDHLSLVSFFFITVCQRSRITIVCTDFSFS